MTIDWQVASALLFVGIALLILVRWRTERHAWSDWDVVLGDVRQAMVEWLRLHTGAHLRLLERALRLAQHAHAHDQPGETRRVLGEADDHAGRHVHFGLLRLQCWHDVASTLATLHPLPPLPAHTFRAGPLRRLARVEWLLALPLSSSGRFLLGLRVQRLALELVGFAFAAARRRATHDVGLARALGDMQAGHDDLATLDTRAVRTFECLLRSLPDDDSSAQGAVPR